MANATTKKPSDLVKTCRELAGKHLKKILEHVFLDVGDAITALVEDTADETLRNTLADAAQIISAEREDIERAFHTRLTKHFSQCLRAAPVEQGNKKEDDNQALAGLSLVEEDELEESLAIDNLVGKMHEQFREQLFGVEKRLGRLLARATIDKENNPLGPNAICNAFSDTVQPLEIHIKVKLIIYKLFDKHIMAGGSDLYNEVNGLLIKAGVLPDLQMTTEKRPRAGANNPTSFAQQAAAAAAQPSPPPQQAGVPMAPAAMQGFQSVQQLFNPQGVAPGMTGQGGQPMPQGGVHPPAGAPGVSPTFVAVTPQLVDSLNALQQHPGLDQNSDAFREGIKQQILAEFSQRQDTSNPQQIQQLDAETIDLISMIFDHFLDNQTLPDFVKALIGRLQIPVLKVALVDRHFLTKKAHPARQLLNELSNASLGLNEDAEGERDRLYEKIDHIVKHIVNDFEADISIFKEALQDLRAFLEEEKQSFETAKHAVAAAVQETEKVEKTKMQVAEEIANKLLNVNIPADVRAFLMGPWREVLSDILLKEGDDSRESTRARNFIDDLIWSVEPKNSDEGRKMLIKLLPTVLQRLSEGLKRLDYRDEQIDEVIEMLENYHIASIRGTPAPEEQEEEQEDEQQAVADDAGADMESGDFGDDIDQMLNAMQEEIDSFSGLEDGDNAEAKQREGFEKLMAEMGFDLAKDDAPQIEDEFTDIVRALKPGTWVEFIEGDGHRMRGKLAWTGDEIAGYTFLNRRFKVMAEKSLYALADEFRSGTAAVIEEVALFDKALAGITAGLLKPAG